ncbi:MAG: Gldg family protein [Clostridia bacterium]|nr:Gldg family protein [Clostridia bacterium]
MMKKILSSNVLRALCIILALLITVLLIWATSARQALRFDMSSTGLMTPSADGKQMIQQVENDVDIYLVTRDTPEDVHHAELISRLADQNKHMDFYVIKSGDSRISSLSAAVGQSVSDGQIVVISDKRAVLLTSNDIYTYTVDKTYSLTSYDDITERAVLNAIDYVTRDDMPVVYAVTGHGEATDDGSIRHALFDIGADFRSLPLTSGDEIPDDAACLFIINPTENVGPDVANKILSYLKDGGHLILLTNFTSTLDDLSVITDYYGMQRQGGLVLDSEAGSYISADYQVYLVPYITDTDLANEMSSALLKAVLPLCESISPAPTTRAQLKVVPFLTTSPSGYRKLNPDKVTTL